MVRKTLLIEDEDAIRKLVKINLEREDYQILEAASGEDETELAEKEHPKIVALDIILPSIDRFEVCRVLRQELPNLGITMLTTKAEDLDRTMGLRLGSDDYMIGLFSPTELDLRIKNSERYLDSKNTKTSKENVINHPPFGLDTYTRKFYYRSQEVELAPTKYIIVKPFMENPGEALRGEGILTRIRGNEYLGNSKIVDVDIRRLRSRIEQNPAKLHSIKTV